MTYPDPAGKEFAYLKQIKWRTPDRWLIEREMIRLGGYCMFEGKQYGEGLAHHYKAAITALFPSWRWNKWAHLLISGFAENSEVAVLGPASSGKTFCASAFGLTSFLVWPKGLSVIISTTTKDGLELRIWGAIKKLFGEAKRYRADLPGVMREAKFMLTGANAEEEIRDFRDGIIGVACRVGTTWVGLANYVGVKNDRVMLIADEGSLMGRGFLDSIANLRKNASFKFFVMGNPKDPTDALGIAAEPATELGGWSKYDGVAETRVWKTRAAGGIAIQLCGYDSPNYDAPRGKNPHRGLITPEQIEADLAYYGLNSLQFSMMNLGVMPKGGSSRRVITMQLCDQRNAFDTITWGAGTFTDVVGLDAAYRGTGGDRPVLTHLRFGPDRDGVQRIAMYRSQQVLSIDPASFLTPEEQLTNQCKEYCQTNLIPAQNFGFDSTGRGTLASELARRWSPDVVAIEFGGPPQERRIRAGDPKLESEAYGKMVSALWFAAYYVIDAGQMRGLSRECAEEGAMREWGVNNQATARKTAPVVDVEPKDKTKLRMGRSPDLFDSYVVAIEMARRRGFIIAGGPKLDVVSGKAPQWAVEALRRRKLTFNRQSLQYA